MVFDLGIVRVQATLASFNDFVLFERDKVNAPNILLMGFDALGEIDLLEELNSPRLRRIVQLSSDDDCTIFCGIRMVTDGARALGIATAHKGKLYDIIVRTSSPAPDQYINGDRLRIYNTIYGKMAVLVDYDGNCGNLWDKIQSADLVFCITDSDEYSCQISKHAVRHALPTIILTPKSSVLVQS